jgi:outer membrane protein OmpA-like peptidoglycan-associated protein
MARPLLDDLELELVQKIDSTHDHVLTQTDVPGLEGDFLKSEGRRATRFTLTGVVTGDDSAEDLKALREKFAAATPVPFVSDISTATRVDQVLVEEMGVRELAGRPQRFEYAFTLREFIPASEPEIIIPPPPPPPPPPGLATSVEVKVIVEDEPNFDMSTVTVTAKGTTQDGASLNQPIPRQGQVFVSDPMEPGRFNFAAVAPEPAGLTGQTDAEVIRGVHPNHVTIRMRRGARIGVAFMVHYRFDKSFVEPCMRHVLKEVFDRVNSGPADEKLLIVGHTDKTGDNNYNQSLSERRARGVFAHLTYGANPAAAVAEWDQLRRQKIVNHPTINDNWGTHQYQYMLQDLGFYNGQVDGDHGEVTTRSVRRFQTENGLTPSGFVNDATWPVLIDRYLKQDSFRIPDAKFLPNCAPEILKWVGCGEEDPVVNTEDAERRNRRTELIFVRIAEFPCEVARPVTFDLPAPGAVAGGWCVGPPQGGSRTCFLRRTGDGNNDPQRILVQPTHQPGAAVVLTMSFEDGRPAAGIAYALFAPDGEMLPDEVHPRSNPRRGEPIPGRTDSQGRALHVKDSGAVGVWTLEIQAPFVVRLRQSPPGSGKGNVVCKRLTGDGEIDVILTARPASFEFVDATNVDQTIDLVVFGQPFRLRADLPGETRDEVTVELMSYLIRR